MPRRAVVMSAARVRTACPGRYCDGGATGLYLLVRDAEHRFWVFRYMVGGKPREAGLGAAVGPSAVPLAKARERARAMYEIVRDGRDPLLERNTGRALQAAAAQKATANAVTFSQVADRYLRAHEATWRNPKHRQQWRNTLRDYVLPVIGDMPVGGVTIAEVMTIVEPLWHTKPETASRVRGRIETILDYARARGWRNDENPARWRGHLENLLPARGKVARVRHHPALRWRDVGMFMERLRGAKGVAALALRFIVLTAARSGEARGARWNEIDIETGIWLLPPERMKGGREHRAVLSSAALALLHEVAPLRQKPDGYVFPGGRTNRPLSDTAVSKVAHMAGGIDASVHGLRSSFRDWAAECTSFPGDVAEMALAHTVRDKVEAAYRRGDLLQKRRELMDAWASYLESSTHIPLGLK